MKLFLIIPFLALTACKAPKRDRLYLPQIGDDYQQVVNTIGILPNKVNCHETSRGSTCIATWRLHGKYFTFRFDGNDKLIAIRR